MFSVVVPSYQQGIYLPDALMSIIQQEADFEILVLDGGSSDNSVAVIQEYSEHIAWWRSERDGGQAQAVNEGVRRAKGEVICWLNSDDFLVSGALKSVEEAFRSDPSLEMLVGSAFWCSDDASSFSYWSAPKRLVLSDLSKAYSFLAQPSVFLRRSVWERLGFLNEGLHFSLDYDFWIRCLKMGVKARSVFRPLSVNRIQPTAKSRDSRMFVEIYEQAKVHFPNVSSRPPTGYADAFGLELFRILPFAFILSTAVRKIFSRGSMLPGSYLPARYRDLAVAPPKSLPTLDKPKT